MSRKLFTHFILHHNKAADEIFRISKPFFNKKYLSVLIYWNNINKIIKIELPVCLYTCLTIIKYKDEVKRLAIQWHNAAQNIERYAVLQSAPRWCCLHLIPVICCMERKDWFKQWNKYYILFIVAQGKVLPTIFLDSCNVFHITILITLSVISWKNSHHCYFIFSVQFCFLLEWLFSPLGGQESGLRSQTKATQWMKMR